LSQDKTLNYPADLIKEMTDENINNLLIGNGFCLSHPDLKDCFEWDMEKALIPFWKDMVPTDFEDCPEKDLNTIRINITKRILQYYIDNLKEKLSLESENLYDLRYSYQSQIKYKCSDFLNAPTLKSGNIFTLNYDPLLYFEILEVLENLSADYFDGFIGKNNGFLDQNYIACNLCRESKSSSSNIKVHYLHGSWFIQANAEEKLRKLSFRKGSDDTIDSLFENERRPFLILEDRWQTKEAILSADPYLKFCHDQLKTIEGNLLIFGCSFKNDEHILRAIKGNSSLKKIFVTYIIDKDKDNLAGKFNGSSKNIQFLQISENVIWKLPQIPLAF
jgi:hypothetical protein